MQSTDSSSDLLSNGTQDFLSNEYIANTQVKVSTRYDCYISFGLEEEKVTKPV